MSSKSLKSGEAAASSVSADAVREFYTSHPYPPPLENLDRARDLWQDENVHRAEYHLLWPNKEYRPDFNVLVAGCGTWQSLLEAFSRSCGVTTRWYLIRRKLSE